MKKNVLMLMVLASFVISSCNSKKACCQKVQQGCKTECKKVCDSVTVVK